MIRVRTVAATAIAVATAFTLQVSGSATALAGDGNGAATQFTAPDPYSMDFTGDVDAGYAGPVDLGTWDCSGVRVTNNHFVRDNFTCTTTATDVTATFSDTLPWPCGCSGWGSDLDGTTATRYEINISDGTVSGWAIYS
jgi:hypothetical protein